MKAARISDVVEGATCSVAGRVIRTYEARGSFCAVLLDDSKKIIVCSNSPFSIGQLLAVSGKATRNSAGLELNATEVLALDEGQAELGSRIDAFIEANSSPVDAQMLIRDGVMRSLHHVVLECARRILRARFLQRPIVMRYHGDADGIGGGLALYRTIGDYGGRFIHSQNWGAEYEVPDALRDLSSVRSFGESTLGPLLILVDLGSGPDNADSLSLLKGAGFEILLIDHHPISSLVTEEVDCTLSPMLAGATSFYTAGLLAGEVAKAMGGPDPTELQFISLAGDKSGLIEHSPESKKKALALDYLGKYSKFQNTLEFYWSTLTNEKMLASVHGQASQKLERAVRVARESLKAKELQNGFRLCTVNLQKVFKPGDFPGKGMLAGALHDQVMAETKGPLVTIGYSGRLISIRANAEARERGFDANGIIESVNRELINSIESGGGHDVAASLHVNDGFENIVLEEIVRHISAL